MHRPPTEDNTPFKKGTSHGYADAHAPRVGTKQAMLINMLRREHGASIQELVDGTGWQPNTVHSALTTLRKRGCKTSIKLSDRKRRYQITSAESN